MNLQMDFAAVTKFKSASQQARVLTEYWAEQNLYCVNCTADKLLPFPPNTQALDFACKQCSALYQLKSQKSPIGPRIVDAGYTSMCRSILSNRTPNLVILHYDRASWKIHDAILVPSFGFTLSAVEARRPLAATARRAGWIGCNILLKNIPPDLRIPLVIQDGSVSRLLVRSQYASMSSLRSLDVTKRGWLLDVLNIARSLGKPEFSINDLYSCEAELEKIHPRNHHVRAKIRQQLQKLRDMGLLAFLGEGQYRLRQSNAFAAGAN